MSKYPCLLQGWSLGILREREVSIAEIFKAMQETKLEIPCRWKGPNQKAILCGGGRGKRGMDIFGITKWFATRAYLLNINQQRNWLVLLAHMLPFMLAVKYLYKKRDWESGALVAQDNSTKNCTIILRASKFDLLSCLSCQLNNYCRIQVHLFAGAFELEIVLRFL